MLRLVFYGRVKGCLTSKPSYLTFQISQKEIYIIKTLRDIFLNQNGSDLKNIKYDKGLNG